MSSRGVGGQLPLPHHPRGHPWRETESACLGDDSGHWRCGPPLPCCPAPPPMCHVSRCSPLLPTAPQDTYPCTRGPGALLPRAVEPQPPELHREKKHEARGLGTLGSLSPLRNAHVTMGFRESAGAHGGPCVTAAPRAETLPGTKPQTSPRTGPGGASRSQISVEAANAVPSADLRGPRRP